MQFQKRFETENRLQLQCNYTYTREQLLQTLNIAACSHSVDFFYTNKTTLIFSHRFNFKLKLFSSAFKMKFPPPTPPFLVLSVIYYRLIRIAFFSPFLEGLHGKGSRFFHSPVRPDQFWCFVKQALSFLFMFHLTGLRKSAKNLTFYVLYAAENVFRENK